MHKATTTRRGTKGCCSGTGKDRGHGAGTFLHEKFKGDIARA
jgi:hypothetical protein